MHYLIVPGNETVNKVKYVVYSLLMHYAPFVDPVVFVFPFKTRKQARSSFYLTCTIKVVPPNKLN